MWQEELMFTNRKEAGVKLAEALAKYKSESPVVLAVPRGGVPVGYEVAHALDAPLDIIVARKLGAPGEPELGLGAVVDGDHPETVLNQNVVAALGVSEQYLRAEIESQLREIRRRQKTYRKGRPAVEVTGRTVIIIDDGIATGGSIRAALRGVRRLRPKKVVLAVPVAPPETIEALRPEADDVVCLGTPADFVAIGEFYQDFSQTEDEEVIRLLEAAAHRGKLPNSARPPSVQEVDAAGTRGRSRATVLQRAVRKGR